MRNVSGSAGRSEDNYCKCRECYNFDLTGEMSLANVNGSRTISVYLSARIVRDQVGLSKTRNKMALDQKDYQLCPIDAYEDVTGVTISTSDTLPSDYKCGFHRDAWKDGNYTICNPDGEFPCCRDPWAQGGGRCAANKVNCQCPGCLDFTGTNLYVFIKKGKTRFFNF